MLPKKKKIAHFVKAKKKGEKKKVGPDQFGIFGADTTTDITE